MEEFCETEFWNFNSNWYTETPDFTTCFKQTVLVWIPCAFLWIFLPLSIYNLKNSEYRDIPWSYFNTIKLILIYVIAIILLLNIIHSCFFTNFEPRIYQWSIVIYFITTVLFVVLTYSGIKMGIVSSGTLLLYSFLCVLCGLPTFLTATKNWIPSTRTEANTKQLSHILIYFCNIITLVMNCFADKTPRHALCAAVETNNNTKSRSVLSNIFSTWMDTYFWKCYKKSTDKITWNYSYKDDGSKNFLRSTNESKNISTLKILNKEYGLNFWYCNLLYILYETAGVSLLVIFGFLMIAIDEQQSMWKCYMYMVVFFAITMTQVIIIAYYWNWCNKLEIRVKNTLTITLYEKKIMSRQALRVSSQSKTEYTTSDIVSMMSMDVNQLQSALKNMHSLSAMSIQTVLLHYYLWFILGSCVWFCVIFFILLMVISYYASVYMKKLQSKEVRFKDTRNRFLQQIFTAIKVLKMYAWEYSFENVALDMREKEEKNLKLIQFVYVLFQTTLSLSPFLLFLISYIGRLLLQPDELLGLVEIFIAMVIFYAFRNTLHTLPHQCIAIQQGSIALKRIDKFLSAEELDPNAITHDSKVPSVLLMKQATFSWVSKPSPAALHNLDVRVEKGELVAVVGSVGAGKSSFISACLGEMYKVSGYINTKGSIAYVPQQAWILNRTVKENVTLNMENDNELYEKAIESCALKADIITFPGGDQTEIGEKGINLSGGQKQRVSLARAIYRNADVYYFDDPLSALDSHVANHVFHEVMGPKGILKEKTRILITHCAKFFPFVDKIILLKNGYISEVGTYEELITNNEEFIEFVRANLEEIGNQKDNEIERLTDTKNPSSAVNEGLKKRKREIHVNSTDSQEDATNVNSNNLTSEENVQTNQILMQFIRSYITMAGIRSTTIVLILFAIGQISFSVCNVWICIWSMGEDALKNQYTFLLVYIGFGLVMGLSSSLGNIDLFTRILTFSSVRYKKLLDGILHWPMSSFDTIPVGRIISRTSDDVYVLDNAIGFNLSQNLIIFLRLFVMIVALIAVLPETMLIIIPFILIFYSIQVLFTPMFHNMKRIEAIHRSTLYSHLVETVEGFQSIRAYNLENAFIFVTQQKNRLWSAAYYSSALCTKWLSNRCEMGGAFFYFFLIAVVIHRKDDIPFGYLVIALTFAYQVLKGVGMAVLQLSLLEDNILSMERIDQYIKQPQESSWDDGSITVDEEWPRKGAIMFQDYKLQYRTGMDCVLKGISFQINHGQKVGIIGRTGAGKTSIFLGLFRIVEPAGGTILIDGVDITKLGLHVLRTKITVIPQDPVLFSGTIRFNLDPFGKHSDDSLWNVLEKSHLKQYVHNLSEKLNHVIQEGGRNLSFGQRQLICLARTLLRKTKILVLDEATASVDVKTDELIQKIIRNEFSDCTVLTIAHRLNTLQNYDKIMVLHEGNLVQYDTLENLLKSKDLLLNEMIPKQNLQ